MENILNTSDGVSKNTSNTTGKEMPADMGLTDT